MKKLHIVILSLFIFGCFSQKKKMDEVEFTVKYLEVVSKRYPQVNYETKENLVIKATFGDNKEIIHYLDNAYRAYKIEPTELDEVLETFIKAKADLYNEREETIDINRIVPIIKPKEYFDDLKLLGKDVENYQVPDLIWEKYNEDLIIVYAEDRENDINYFTQDKFEALNIDKDTLLQFAVDNLDNLLPKIEKVGENGNFVLIAGGDYEVSLILMSGLWTKNNFDVDGDIVIAIPNRDLVFITGSNDLSSIEKLKATVEESYETGNYNLTKNFYKWNGIKFIGM